jgi:hypothetical protein
MADFKPMITNDDLRDAYNALKAAIEDHGSSLIPYTFIPENVQELIAKVIKPETIDTGAQGVGALWKLIESHYNNIKPRGDDI